MSAHNGLWSLKWCFPFVLIAAASCSSSGPGSSAVGNTSGNGGSASTNSNGGGGNGGSESAGTANGSGGGSASGSSATGGSASGSSSTAGSTAGTATAGDTSTSSGGSATAGTASGGDDASGDDDSGSLPPACTNTDLTTLPMDATGWIPRNCNNYGIQGAWYCFADTAGTSNCQTGVVPYVAASKGMCISGMTSSASSAYGAAIGLELNASGGTSSVKSAYNATSNKVVGFEITITGSSGGIGLRLSFTGAASTSVTQPFVELPGAGTYQVMLADTLVPASFTGSSANTRANPAAIYDVQLGIPATAAVGYNYCITNLTPILASAAPTTPTACATPTAYGSAVCAAQDTLGEVASTGQTALYAVQNNVNVGGTPQCVQALAGGTCVGFTSTLTNGNLMGSNVQSYPSIIYGWQAGSFYGGYRTAKQISSIASAPTKWTFTTPSGGSWDASYDIWFAPTAAPATAAGGTELMIWQNYSGMQPAGSQSGTKTINGATYEVWKGNVNTWQYIAYRASSPNSNAVNYDLLNFFKDAVNENVGMSNSSYLLGIQSGFEVTSLSKGATMSTSNFSVSVN